MKKCKKHTFWELGHVLGSDICQLSKVFPKEAHGLASKTGRTAYAIPTNIVKACGLGSDTTSKKFPFFSVGTASNWKYFTTLSRNLGYTADIKFGIILI
ncbi:four helix bundle protein [Croceitalea dokdonensis]|uniref:four helix bundle protein n=1 Tax=Croceitalea dokdonensis TaxID=346188 RepID=UPI0006C9EA07